jgi:prepilin-type N-terminal cleavage/methylation domain-containing protein
MKRIFRNHNGFTLIEVLIIIAILGILAGMAAPFVGRQIRDYRIGAAVRDLQSAVQGARMAAIRRGADIGLEFDLANNQCTTFVDDGANQLLLEADDTVIGTLSMPDGVDLYATSTGGTMIQFSSRGMLNSPAATEWIQLKSSDGNYRGVSIRITGSSVVVKSGDGVTWL